MLPLQAVVPGYLPASHIPYAPARHMAALHILPGISDRQPKPTVSALTILCDREAPSLKLPQVHQSDRNRKYHTPPRLRLPAPGFFAGRARHGISLRPLPAFPSPSPHLQMQIRPPWHSNKSDLRFRPPSLRSFQYPEEALSLWGSSASLPKDPK